jgi:transcriptional regulator with XRE-family HTH domain
VALLTLRKENHITQVQMAQKLGVSQQQIASYEAGRVKIPVSMLPKLTAVLATPVGEILGVEQRSKRGPASRLQQQVERISHLPRGKQKFIIEMLDALLQKEKMVG